MTATTYHYHYETVERLIRDNFGDAGDIDFMEIGVAGGKMEKHLINVFPAIRITCVDLIDNPFSTEEQARINFVQGHSSAVIDKFKGLVFDFVYIDGGHSYDQCKQDIIDYSTIVNKNGIIAGHDYHPNQKGVVTAVDELLPHRLLGQDLVWYVKKEN